MIKSEFDIIDLYFKSDNVRDDVITHIGDDAAQISPEPGKQLIVHINTLAKEIQEYENVNPADIVDNLMMPGINNITSKGGSPAYATLAITLPSVNQDWLSGFRVQLNRITNKHNIEIIGGDTTHGPASMCCHVMGYVESTDRINPLSISFR